MARVALMGLDLGTTAVKVGLFDADSGEALGVARSEYTPVSPRPGWLELEACEYRRAAVEATRAAHAQAGAPRVVGIGLSSQGQTFMPLDGSHRPLRPAIVWLDTRAEEQARRLSARFDPDELRRRRGVPAFNAIDSAPKMLWLREHEPEMWAATRHLVMLPDYLGLMMTGALRLDLCNAGSTGLVDRTVDDWWQAGLDAVGVQREWLSPLGWPGERIGGLTVAAARELGLEAGTPVALGSNDQLNGAVGAGNVEPGLASGTAGTAMAIIATLAHIPEPMPDGMNWGKHPVPGLWYLLNYAKTSGVVLTWLRDLLGAGDYDALLAEAEQVPAGSDGLVCLPHFSGTATPTFRSDVRGGFVGLTLGHGRGHLVRAVVEAVCFCARDALALTASIAQSATELRMLGGAAQSDWWMQVMADTVRLPVAIPACAEAAVLGGAIFGGVAAGRLESIEAGARRFYRTAKRLEPRAEMAEVYDAAYAAYRDAMERVYPGALGAQRQQPIGDGGPVRRPAPPNDKWRTADGGQVR